MSSCLSVTLLMFLTTALLQCPTEVLCCPAAEARCIFDEVQPRVVSKSTLSYGGGRGKRSTSEALWQPIRIQASIQDLDDIVDTSEVERLAVIINGATSIIRNILSVVPVSGPLLMSRSDAACQTSFIVGNNTGKCQAVSRGYEGEKCLDDFLIPNEHLEGLWTWNSTHPDPIVTVFPSGSGLADTDTVLYIKAEHTGQCTSGQIVAYAAYCKLDQNNRPIAGVINFCPKHLRDDLYDEPKFILLAVHEIFHVLGFSSSLFDKFKECTESADRLTCIDRCTTTGTDSQGLKRLITPAVTVHAQRHFDCPESGFGGPLENQAGDSVSSHWETRMMYGSIMAPIVNQPHQTFLDNLTLAVFEDSGWYKVNYEHAQDIPWGKGQGCEFGRESGCQSMPSRFFCNDSSSSCHYLHEDKATCSSNDYFDGCRVMTASKEDQCSEQGDGSTTMNGEVFHEDSRCFISNAVNSEATVEPCDLTGACYLTRCDNQSSSYEVKVGQVDWQSCPEGTVITIPGYLGSVHCPSTEVICRQKTSILDLVDAVCQSCLTIAAPSSTESGDSPVQPFEHTLCITLEFEAMDLSTLGGAEQMKVFGEAVVRGVCDITELEKSQIAILEVTPGSSSPERETDSLHVTFDIAGAEGETSDISLYMAYNDLEQAVLASQMQVQYMDMNYTAVSIRIVSASVLSTSNPQTSLAMADSDLPTWIALATCFALLVAVVLLGWMCYKSKRSNSIRPSDSDSDSDKAERIPGLPYRVKEKELIQL